MDLQTLYVRFFHSRQHRYALYTRLGTHVNTLHIKKEFTSDMKNIYNAPNKEVAETELDNLERKWAGKYPYAVISWRKNWDDLTVFFSVSTGDQKNYIYDKSY